MAAVSDDVSDSAQAIALNRFGLGARPDEAPPGDPPGWLRAQLKAVPPPAATGLPDTAQIVQQTQQAQQAIRDAADPADKRAARDAANQQARETYLAAVQARANAALATPAPLAERLVFFWSNHFALSVEKPEVQALAGAFEDEAIRPHVMGRFEDLLVAAEHHPAMLQYLDQSASVGPNSPSQKKAARPRGLNENLAREIMELHTLGVRSGYTQADVTEFARALTGWGLAGTNAGPRDRVLPNGSAFRPGQHEPGTRTVLGRRYADSGERQGADILHDLATTPATATHLSMKLARHFVADDPPPALVERLTGAWLRSRGDLPTVYRVLIDAPEAWAAQPAKFKTPWEWAVSSARGLGWRAWPDKLRADTLLAQLGQPVWRPGSPAGWDDIGASWAAPDALVRRIDWAQRLAARADRSLDARVLAPQLLPGGALQPATAQAIARAESPATALALLLVAPDFLRR